MGVFHYRAYSAGGRAITGSLEAENLATLETRLRAAGGWLLEAREGGELVAGEKEKASPIRIKGAEIIAFFVQMSLLLKAGVTLAVALERLATTYRETRLGTVIEGLHEQVAIGVPLNEAMGNFPRVFSRQVTAMIQAGEASGQMPEVFESLCRYYEWLDQLTSDIRQALIYPVMVISASVVMVLMLFTFVVPRFVSLLVDLHLQVPFITRMVMAISNGLVAAWPILVAAILGIPVAAKLLLRVPSVARAVDRGLMRLPIFGELIAMFGLSRFSQNLAMLYRSGIPLVRGLEISSGIVGNRAIERAVLESRLGVLEGAPLHRCLAHHDVFPGILVTMIATGETSGSLDVALQSVSDYYNKIIPRRIKVIFAIFDPAMMLTLIAVVGTVALAVILPILQLWSSR